MLADDGPCFCTGFVNTLLSWKALVPLSRLTYSAYLIHIIVIYLDFMGLRQTFALTDLSLVSSRNEQMSLIYHTAHIWFTSSWYTWISWVYKKPSLSLTYLWWEPIMYLGTDVERIPVSDSLKHWIAFCRCSQAIWIASERRANEMHCDAWKFAILSDAIQMAREHRQNAIQYLYLHLFTTKFVAISLSSTQKCHISQISNVRKVRHLE